MQSLKFHLDDIHMEDLSKSSEVNVTEKKDAEKNLQVAIIGMSGKVGTAGNLDEFWDMLVQEKEGFSNISKERKEDILEYLTCRGVSVPIEEERWIRGTHMPDIDKFDYNFFSISHQEAIGMDPNQRIFLETAWEALEDAGCASEEIKGTDTGVFVGMSSDFGAPYRDVIQTVSPDAPEIMVAGNIKSMIASRLAYQLDLRGPAMLIDTACSSGLTAVYTAMRSLQNGECSMAVAGGVKCDMLPITADTETGVGIKDIQATADSGGHTRTFDHNCDGTNTAEGAFVFVLKLLEDAKREEDHIYAVIMGGAVNQDGASNGITAPNVESQGELIRKAIMDAGIEAEKISYIEAHGTATKLGDPIEVKGIEQAFSHFTKRKQFVGISSVKTNIGHLDNVSGLAGLAKVVLAMKNRILPASLNFEQPNRTISFLKSPVYVLDRTTKWADEGEEVYAGINSFGISGTNCHLILKSADRDVLRQENPVKSQTYLLPISARSKKSLSELVKRYGDMLAEKKVNLQNMAYTASVGRMHFNYRVCFLFSTQEELIKELKSFGRRDHADNQEEVFFYGEFRVVADDREQVRIHDISERERIRLSEQAKQMIRLRKEESEQEELKGIAELYRKGASVPWEELYEQASVHKISLPVYPFEPLRCWMKSSRPAQKKHGMLYEAQSFESYDRFECITKLAVEHFWELAEHRIHGYCVLPGTALIELILEAAGLFGLGDQPVQLQKVMFENPLIVEKEEKQVHVICSKKDYGYLIQITCKNAAGQWEENAQAELILHHQKENKQVTDKKLPISNMLNLFDRKLKNDNQVDVEKGLQISDRWTESYVQGKANPSFTEFLVEFKLPEQYEQECLQYCMHPALMDTAVNALNNIIENTILFLPFSYEQIKVYQPLPPHIFVYFQKQPDCVEGMMHSFQVQITDADGTVCMDIENYCIKSAMNISLPNRKQYGYKRSYQKIAETQRNVSMDTGKVLVYGTFPASCQNLGEKLREKGCQCIVIEEENVNMLDTLQGEEFACGIFSASFFSEMQEETELQEEEITRPVEEAFKFLKKLAECNIKFRNGVTAITCQASCVENQQSRICPGQAGLVGLWKVAALEFKQFSLTIIDIDETITVRQVIDEIFNTERKQIQYYRHQEVYEECIKRESIQITKQQSFVKGDGVFVISGGTGELGTELALYLAKKQVRKIILLGSRNSQQKRKEWTRLKEICSVFEVIRITIEAREEVTETLQRIREKYGKIAGVFHLAGVAGDGFLYSKTMERFMEVYKTKAVGALNLHLATKEDSLDYFIAYSSIASLLVNMGQSDYTAANMVLDSLAEYRKKEGQPALSIQWPAWRETGIAHRMHAVDEEEEFQPLDTEEAFRLLNCLLSGDIKESVIMAGTRVKPTNDRKPPADKKAALHTQREVMVTGIEKPDEIDRQVAGIWLETLEMEEIDAYDEFGDLGGNSLLMTQMLKAYEVQFPGVFDITDLFLYTTIASQSKYVKESLGVVTEHDEWKEKDETVDQADELDKLLGMLEVGAISLEDTKKILL